MCKDFGIDNDKHHDAMNDARLAAMVHKELVKLLYVSQICRRPYLQGILITLKIPHNSR
ncbi:MAG: hypothetical protein MK132_25715 [Lentisphaerales bacterium]|nr:hypothetical protein [Lentisphaerales bacterium]